MGVQSRREIDYASLMSLGFLVLMVVAGLAMAIGAVHFSGLSQTVALRDAAQARAAYLADYPQAVIAAVHLDRNGRSALLRLDNGRIGLVLGFGAHFVTREIRPTDLRSVRIEDSELVMNLADFTLPEFRLRCPDAGEAGRIARELSADHPSLAHA